MAKSFGLLIAVCNLVTTNTSLKILYSNKLKIMYHPRLRCFLSCQKKVCPCTAWIHESCMSAGKTISNLEWINCMFPLHEDNDSATLCRLGSAMLYSFCKEKLCCMRFLLILHSPMVNNWGAGGGKRCVCIERLIGCWWWGSGHLRANIFVHRLML